jgi:hypothetical protein
MGKHLMGVHLMGVHHMDVYLGGKYYPPLNLWALIRGHLFLMGCSRKAPNHT